jgi:hypothetical protein
MATSSTPNSIPIESSLASLFGAYQQYQQNQQFSQGNATSGAQGTVDALFREFKNDALPKIHAASNTRGAYNSTTEQLLANDAYASTVAKAAQAMMSNRVNFGQLQSQYKGINGSAVGNDLSNLLGAIRAFKNGGAASDFITNNPSSIFDAVMNGVAADDGTTSGILDAISGIGGGSGGGDVLGEFIGGFF